MHGRCENHMPHCRQDLVDGGQKAIDSCELGTWRSTEAHKVSLSWIHVLLRARWHAMLVIPDETESVVPWCCGFSMTNWNPIMQGDNLAKQLIPFGSRCNDFIVTYTYKSFTNGFVLTSPIEQYGNVLVPLIDFALRFVRFPLSYASSYFFLTKRSGMPVLQQKREQMNGWQSTCHGIKPSSVVHAWSLKYQLRNQSVCWGLLQRRASWSKLKWKETVILVTQDLFEIHLPEKCGLQVLVCEISFICPGNKIIEVVLITRSTSKSFESCSFRWNCPVSVHGKHNC